LYPAFCRRHEDPHGLFRTIPIWLTVLPVKPEPNPPDCQILGPVSLAFKKPAADQKQTFLGHGAEICNEIGFSVVS
jgi:hypothetical protein